MESNSLRERNEHLFTARMKGAKLQDLANEAAVTPQAVSQIVLREGRRHIEALVPQIWAAQKDGAVFTLAIPAWVRDDDQARAIAYLQWVLTELPAHGVEPRVHYRPAFDGGCVFGIEDTSFRVLNPNRKVR